MPKKPQYFNRFRLCGVGSPLFDKVSFFGNGFEIPVGEILTIPVKARGQDRQSQSLPPRRRSIGLGYRLICIGIQEVSLDCVGLTFERLQWFLRFGRGSSGGFNTPGTLESKALEPKTP